MKGIPALAMVDSLDIPTSFPYDFMHLIMENLIPNLTELWSKPFKNLGPGTETYTFEETVWEAMGMATERAGSTIPSAYGGRVPNLEKDRTSMTAETWSFWAQYIAPVVLRQRLQAKYSDHFFELIQLINI